MIIPYRADIELNRLPFLTIFISIICLCIYVAQVNSGKQLNAYTANYCSQKMTRILQHVFQKTRINGNPIICEQFLSEVYTSPNIDEELHALAGNAKQFKSLSLASSQRLITKELNAFYRNYETYVPKDWTVHFWYYPGNWSVTRMLTSSLAHGSWSHVIGNLFFFFAFAATIEIILGVGFYLLSFVTVAVGTSVLYSFYSISVQSNVPTLGLSGVVAGFMGMFMYFAPTINIRNVLWIILPLFRFSIPAWIMVLMYVGYDAYKLVSEADWQGTNLVAHVGGGFIGYLLGITFFSARKQSVQKQLRKRRRDRG